MLLNLLSLSVDFRHHIVERSANRNQVGNLLAAGQVVDNAGKTQTCAVDLHAVRRLLALAVDINTENASACLNFLIPMSFRKLDNLRHLSAIVSLWDIVDKLLKNLARLLNLFQAHQVAVERVAAVKHNLLEIKLAVDGVRIGLAEVARPARSTSRRTCHTIIHSIFLRQHA